MTWTIKYLRSAKKGLKNITPKDRERIKAKIEELAEAPNPEKLGKKLKGNTLKEFYRIRVGNYRIIYHTENGELILVILKIGHRKEVYK